MKNRAVRLYTSSLPSQLEGDWAQSAVVPIETHKSDKNREVIPTIDYLGCVFNDKSLLDSRSRSPDTYTDRLRGHRDCDFIPIHPRPRHSAPPVYMLDDSSLYVIS
ncbi:UNVERIFIED_CONTAM: hypothetical protein K2H54_049660 [Gekko kuhli]